MTRTEKMFAWIGGLVLGGLAVAGVAYGASAAPSKPSSTTPPSTGPTPATSLNPTVAYVFAAKVPSGVHDADTLIQQLAAAGWSNITIGYFGPTGSTVPGLKIPFTVDSSMYVAGATWSGAVNAPIPPGVSAVLSATL